MKLLGHRLLVHFDPPVSFVALPETLAPLPTDGTIVEVGSKVRGNALVPGQRIRVSRHMGSVPYDHKGQHCRIVSTLDVELVLDAP